MLAQILISFKMLVIYKILCPFFFLINFANCELLLTHVLFSSGEVVPLSYPGDVYKNHMHFKQFSGTLTKEGELSSYFLGQQLRTRYDDFLGNIYQTNLSQGYSTYFQASQSSLQCVHLGLYPPQGVQKFESNLNWQPVPYKILKPSYDKFLSPLQFCGKSSWNLPSNMNYSQMYKMLSEKIGQQVTTNEDIYHIYHSFNYQEKNNFHLPQWVEQEESHILKDLEIASTEFFKQLIQERKAIGVGRFLKEIINLTEQKLNQTLKPPDRKMFLYSGDIFNVMFILSALTEINAVNVSDSSCVLLELHRVNDQVGFKLFYQLNVNQTSHISNQKNEPQGFQQVNILDCGEFCLMDDFVNKAKKFYEPNPECF